MEHWLVWLVIGFILVISEMLSGTFYLLAIGVGAFAGSIASWLGGNEIVQAATSGAVAVLGTYIVHTWHARQKTGKPGEGNFLDRGQAVVLEGWAQQDGHVARVKYRGASWDARMAHPGQRPAPGTTLYIEGQEGNTLVVAAVPPAP